MRVISFVLNLACGAAAIAADQGANIYKDLPETARQKFTKVWEYQVEVAEKDVEAAQKQIRSAKGAGEKKKAVAQLEKQKAKLAAVKKNDPPVVPTLDSFEVGAIGRVGVGTVRQVIDGKTLLVEFANREGTHAVRVDDTSKTADGDIVQPRGLSQVTKTVKFSTTLGATRTVYLIEPFTPPWETKPAPKPAE